MVFYMPKQPNLTDFNRYFNALEKSYTQAINKANQGKIPPN